MYHIIRISGLVVEYIVAIDVTRVRFPADAYLQPLRHYTPILLIRTHITWGGTLRRSRPHSQGGHHHKTISDPGHVVINANQ